MLTCFSKRSEAVLSGYTGRKESIIIDVYCDDNDCYVSGKELIKILRGSTFGDLRRSLSNLNLKINVDYFPKKNDADVRIEPMLKELKELFPVFHRDFCLYFGILP